MHLASLIACVVLSLAVAACPNGPGPDDADDASETGDATHVGVEVTNDSVETVTPAACPAEIDQLTLDELDDLTGAYVLVGNLDWARCAAEKLLTLVPEHALAINNLAFVHIQAGELDQALDLLRPIAMQSGAPALLQNLAVAASRAGDHTTALAAADALVQAEPDELCVGVAVREAIRLRAHVADEAHARDVIVHHCNLVPLWEKLVGEGVASPTPPEPDVCIPVVGVPDERSVCPTGECGRPAVFAIPDCIVHPDVCAANPYLYNYDFDAAAEVGAATFGEITGAIVYAATWDVTEVTCQGETMCSDGSVPQPDRGLAVTLAGPAVIQPSFSLKMPGGEPINIGKFRVIFPLFPQRVIHPSSEAAELGCPDDMKGPFYHFESLAEMYAVADETLTAMAAMDAFRVHVDMSIPDFEPNMGYASHYWEAQTCPASFGGPLPLIQCQDATLVEPNLPSTSEGVIIGSDCGKLFTQGVNSLKNPTFEQIIMVEARHHEADCGIPAAPPVEGNSLDINAILAANGLPGVTKSMELFVSPGGGIDISLSMTGTLDIELRSGWVMIEGAYNPLTEDFDLRAGAGPSLSLGNNIASGEYVFGFGMRGNRYDRSLTQLYAFHAASVCFLGSLKIGKDYAMPFDKMEGVGDALNATFKSHGKSQLAHSARP